MKNILKISILTVMTVFFLFLLTHMNIIQVDLIKKAIRAHMWLILAIGALQILNYCAIAFRYRAILNILGLKEKIQNPISTTFVSNGIGQWLPGSIVFIEVLKMGLIFKTKNNIFPNSDDKYKVAIASVLDRMFGIFTALFLSVCVLIHLVINQSSQDYRAFLIGFLGVNASLCTLIALLPIIAGSQAMTTLLFKLESFLLKIFSHQIFQKLLKTIFSQVNSVIKIFSENGKNFKVFLAPIFFSICSILSFTLSLNIAWLALDTNISIFITLAAVSTLSLMGALPISIGGIGAPQLIIAVLFGSLGTNSAIAASAQLLQTGITLFVISFCGAFYLPRIINEIIKPRIA